MVGNFVPENEILMDLKEVVELVVSAEFSEATLCFLETKILDHRHLLRETFPNLRFRPKHHYIEHYPHLIRCFGPLDELWMMRFEVDIPVDKEGFQKDKL